VTGVQLAFHLRYQGSLRLRVEARLGAQLEPSPKSMEPSEFR